MSFRQYDNSITVIRALCVIAIIIFHIEKNWLPLGYLGVDLFFVLSGFLITSIILNQHKKSIFSYYDFYKRRFLRLMPAFYASILLTILAAFLINYHDVELTELIESSVSSLFFLSNFYFWKNTGYFVASASLTENIHHWSLSVEEQFYFIWPITLLTILRFFSVKHWIFILMVMILCFISMYLTKIYPGAAFYLLPTRAWQFLVGALVTIHYSFLSDKLKNTNKSFFLLGIILTITIGNFVPEFDFKIQLCTLVLSIFLAFFLTAGRHGLLLKILEKRPILWLGLASYSIYLVHQPILAVSRKLLRHPDSQTLLFVIIIIFLLIFFGFIIHKIENFFRYRNINGWVLCGLHIFILSFFLLIFYFRPQTTINSDFADPAKFDYGCQYRNNLGCKISSGSSNERTKILLLGNSHARMLLPAFQKSKESLEVLHPDKLSLTILGAEDDIAIQNKTSDNKKEKWMRKICKMSSKFKSVVISFRYIGYLYKLPNVHISKGKVSEHRLQQLDQRLKSLASCVPHLIIISQVPELNFWPRNVFRYSHQYNSGYIPRFLHENVTKPFKDLLLNINKNYSNIDIIYPENFLCDKDNCFAYKTKNDNSINILYYDDDHLNAFGSKDLISKVLKLTKER